MGNQYTGIKAPIIPIGPSIAYIELTKGLFALIDRELAGRIGAVNWYAQWNETTASYYAARSIRLPSGSRRLEWMHKVILGISDDAQGDHVRQVTLDNRLSQLRVVTPSENSLNRRPRGTVAMLRLQMEACA